MAKQDLDLQVNEEASRTRSISMTGGKMLRACRDQKSFRPPLRFSPSAKEPIWLEGVWVSEYTLVKTTDCLGHDAFSLQDCKIWSGLDIARATPLGRDWNSASAMPFPRGHSLRTTYNFPQA